MDKRKRMILSAVPVVLLMGLIFFLSAQDATKSSATSGGVIELIRRLTSITFSDAFIRTSAHFCEYALFGLLVCNLLTACFGYLRPFLSAALAWLYAWSDEFHQLFVPGRAFQLSDLTVDLCGILLGTFILTLIAIAVRKRKQKKNDFGAV